MYSGYPTVCGSTQQYARVLPPNRVSPFRVRPSRSWIFSLRFLRQMLYATVSEQVPVDFANASLNELHVDSISHCCSGSQRQPQFVEICMAGHNGLHLPASRPGPASGQSSVSSRPDVPSIITSTDRSLGGGTYTNHRDASGSNLLLLTMPDWATGALFRIRPCAPADGTEFRQAGTFARKSAADVVERQLFLPCKPDFLVAGR